MLLQVEPELCTRPESIADLPCKVGRDRAVAAQDLGHGLRGKAERPRELGSAVAASLELIVQNLANQ